jgi:preprotein translocase subunit YajC
LSIPQVLADATAGFIAQTTAPTTQGSQQQPPSFIKAILDMGIFLPLLLVMLIFIVMSSRSRKRQEQQKKDMLNQMKRGDRVQTIGGVLGNVVEVRDDRILLKVDESNNTKVWFARSAIHRVLGEEAEAK